MKKKVIFGLILIVIVSILTGCGKKEEDKQNLGNTKVGGWDTVLTEKSAEVPSDAKEAFDKAVTDYVGMDFEVVALLGKQVVAGTNYMFLCKGTPVVPNPKTSYKIVIVYKDLEGKAKISQAVDFDYTKYTNTDKSDYSEELSGGWNVVLPSKGVELESKVQNAFENASKKLQGVTYYPIALLGKQLVSGTNYAIIAYGKTTTSKENGGVYLLTLYEDLDDNQNIISSSYIDLAEFNQ